MNKILLRKNWFFLTVGLTLFIYLLFRAAFVPLVHDEAETFFIYIVNGHYLPYEGYVSANNHFLNSFLGHYAYRFFGPDSPWIRLPNVLSFLLFVYFAILLVNRFKNGWVRNITYLALLTTPFVLEFFGLARGYGMSIALLAGFLYLFIRYLEDFRWKHWMGILVFSHLMMWASLTLFHIYLIGAGLLTLDIIRNKEMTNTSRRVKAVVLLFVTYMPAWFYLTYVLHLGTINELVVTGDSGGLYENTIKTVIAYMVASTNSLAVTVVILFFVLAVVDLWTQLFGIRFHWLLLVRKNPFMIFLIFTILGIALAGYAFDIPFARDRAVLFLVPLFLLTMGQAIDHFANANKAGFLAALPMLYFPVLFLTTANTTHSSYWINKRIPDRYYTYIADHSRNELATIGSMSLRETCWYHKIFRHDQKLNPLYIKNPESDLTTDFKILKDVHTPELEILYTKVDSDLVSGNDLYERKVRLKRILIHQGEIDSFSGKDMYLNLVEYVFPQEEKDSEILIETSFDLKSESDPVEWSLIMEIRSSDNKTMSTETVRLSRIRPVWSNAPMTKLLLTVGKLPPGGDRVLIYLYNSSAVFNLHHGSYKIYKLDQTNP